MTFLTLAQDAADECGVGRPAMIYAGTDATARRLRVLAQREGRSLAKLNWPVLRKEKTFTSLAQETQTAAVASDLSRFVDRTFWNRTATRPFAGPLTPQEWQDLKARTGAGMTDSFTYRGGNILMQPTPTAGHTCAYEYYSTNWCQSSGAVAQSAWAADTDTGILSEDLMSRGLVWRFKKASGMAWENDLADYVAEVRTTLAQSGPAAQFDMAGETWTGPGLFVPPQDWS